jgi:hypothetical protein
VRTTYEERLMATAMAHNMGDPQRQLGPDRHTRPKATPRRSVRVLVAGFFADGKVPEVGAVISLAADDAASLAARGLVEFCR